ncbi:unnamed protein product [Prorocentrum cordatum]|uniref:Uncharacterized protein n=1 Tax=Prorocentrum cordatum TaxID=2364126 RepID=A0ABN9TF53_9DINO|nr:unnamed protein product [Polarella glacialis]
MRLAVSYARASGKESEAAQWEAEIERCFVKGGGAAPEAAPEARAVGEGAAAAADASSTGRADVGCATGPSTTSASRTAAPTLQRGFFNRPKAVVPMLQMQCKALQTQAPGGPGAFLNAAGAFEVAGRARGEAMSALSGLLAKLADESRQLQEKASELAAASSNEDGHLGPAEAEEHNRLGQCRQRASPDVLTSKHGQ